MCTKMIPIAEGIEMPALGFGTWQASDDELEAAMESALEAGYRHIDTAYVYENEAVIGRVLHRWISEGKVEREDLFIVTKLPPVGNRPSDVAKYLKRSLKNLQLNYLDLYLVHTPFAFQEMGDEMHPMDENNHILLDHSTDIIAVWKEMEKQVDEGLVKAIGVSNYNIEQLERILAAARIPPAVLQVEMHLYFQQRELVSFCESNGIKMTAYSPLGSKGIKALFAKIGNKKEIPDLMANPVVEAVAKKHSVQPAQVLLRHIIQHGVSAIPKSTNEARIKANIDIFQFELDDMDMQSLDALDEGSTARICDFTFLKGLAKHPEFPF